MVKITTSNMLWHHFRDTVELEDLHEYGFKSMFAQVERGAMVSIVTMIHDVSCISSSQMVSIPRIYMREHTILAGTRMGKHVTWT